MDQDCSRPPALQTKTVADDEPRNGARPTVAVVICTRDRLAELRTSLTAVCQSRYSTFTILVVNNGSSEPEVREIAREFGARYLYVPVPGLSRARNAAAKVVEEEILAFLDDDAVPEPDWIERLVVEFSDPRVMAVTGRVDPRSLGTESEQIWNELNQWISDRSRHWNVQKDSDEWFEKANFGGMGIGCNMAFRRDAWSHWPGFDVRLGRGAMIDGFEEHLAFFSIIERGFCVSYTPEAAVRHRSPQTMTEARSRHLKDITASTAYASLLFLEFPQYRKQLLHFIVARLRMSPRNWKQRPASTIKLIPRWRAWVAALRGPLVYLWTRLRSADAGP